MSFSVKRLPCFVWTLGASSISFNKKRNYLHHVKVEYVLSLPHYPYFYLHFSHLFTYHLNFVQAFRISTDLRGEFSIFKTIFLVGYLITCFTTILKLRILMFKRNNIVQTEWQHFPLTLKFKTIQDKPSVSCKLMQDK